MTPEEKIKNIKNYVEISIDYYRREQEKFRNEYMRTGSQDALNEHSKFYRLEIDFRDLLTELEED